MPGSVLILYHILIDLFSSAHKFIVRNSCYSQPIRPFYPFWISIALTYKQVFWLILAPIFFGFSKGRRAKAMQRPWISGAAPCISPCTARWQAGCQHPAHRLIHSADYRDIDIDRGPLIHSRPYPYCCYPSRSHSVSTEQLPLIFYDISFCCILLRHLSDAWAARWGVSKKLIKISAFENVCVSIAVRRFGIMDRINSLSDRSECLSWR